MRNWVFVKVLTNQPGLWGWGEATVVWHTRSVVGALQDPRKETLGFRDQFPTRVAMRLPKPMVDLVLGSGMYEAGAQCDLIPPREAGAGVAFVVDEGSTLPTCIRVDWSSDELIRSAVASVGSLRPPESASVPQLARVN